MQEAFLHYLWQAQRFLTSDLRSTTGDRIRVIKTGFLNADSGPDFTNARLQINDVEWAGNVEVHLKSSDWFVHQHQTNKAYENVILHVVWEADGDIYRADGSVIPTLALRAITSEKVVEKQAQLADSKLVIPCESLFSEISEITKSGMLGVAITQRLQQKSAFVGELLKQNNTDWEETAYQVLAKNFGFKLNAEPMLQLTRNLPLKILQKHRNSAFQVEALLFGMAGFLEEATGIYAQKLAKEYDFLAAKYQLKNKQLNAHEWKFLRTRPANFPTIRLAQLVSLVVGQSSFFSLFTQTTSVEVLRKALEVEQPVYWQKHYSFDKEFTTPLKKMGRASVDNLLINTVVPVLVYYAQYIDNQGFISRAEEILESLPAEKNKITEHWKKLRLSIETGFDSQASIELYNNFCSKKKCFSCRIGTEILRTTSD